MLSERIKMIAKKSREQGQHSPENNFNYDKNMYALGKYKELPIREKVTRAVADAIVNQKIYIEPYDEIIGRIFFFNDKECKECDPAFDYMSEPEEKIRKELPDYEEFSKYQLGGTHYRGHIAWRYDKILQLGTEGMKQQYREAISRTDDEKSKEFCRGVIIMLEALERWNDKHIEEFEKRNMKTQAERCRSLRRPARTFREAVQTYFMQYMVVMKEFPAGGNGPGRLDYYLWPYLERDLKNNKCTLEEAKEIIQELFIRIDAPFTDSDGWVEAIVVGGTYPNGLSAVNPLSYIMVEAIMELDIIHPTVYIRLPENPPEDFLELSAKYLKYGKNRAQLFCDKNIIKTLVNHGVSFRDAVDYYSGGCMEIGIQGMSCDYLFNGLHNILKIVELSTTGGLSLNDGVQVNSFRGRGLKEFNNFEDFYMDFIGETRRIITMFLKAQDIYSEVAEEKSPVYLLSSMLEDALKKCRGMHSGGARYHDYGAIPMGLPSAADYLFAIKKAVFDDKICSAEELVEGAVTK